MSRTHPRWNNQLSQFFSDGLGATKAEDTFGNGIEFSDASGGVHSDDAIEREIEDCASAIERIRFFSWMTPSALVLLSFLFSLLRWHRAVQPRLTAWPPESKATSGIVAACSGAGRNRIGNRVWSEHQRHILDLRSKDTRDSRQSFPGAP